LILAVWHYPPPVSRLFFASAFIFSDLREKQYLSVPIVVPITFFLLCFPDPAFGLGPLAILTLRVTKVNSTAVSNCGEPGAEFMVPMEGWS
jgi:hypothetical protein